MSVHGPLAGYRALDLTDHRGALAGRLLADLGVDVVKVEPPGGERSRRVPPFAGDRSGPTRSLSWLPGNFGKRSIELDLDTDAGRARVRRLAAASDFVLESFPPGHLAACGLGWETLARAHPSGHPHLDHGLRPDWTPGRVAADRPDADGARRHRDGLWRA